VYPRLLQAVNTAKWEGSIYNDLGGGQAFFRSASQKTYLTVRPKSGVEAAGASSAWVWAAAAAAVLVVVVVVLLVVRGRQRAVEEA